MCLNVLVLESDPFIAEDIREIVTALEPRAEVHLTESVGHAITLLDQAENWIWAVIDCRSYQLTDPALRVALDQRNLTPVVLNDAAAEARCGGWVFLNKPFSTASLEDALRASSARNSALG
ncbi:hypothetical protein JT55_13400 [Rhodovulum sp. NI22]|nr:hypothetical protein JT55_13400 [Rhodovulum sp. NI22]